MSISVNLVLSSNLESQSSVVYPNPVHGNQLNLSLQEWDGAAQYQLVDLSGKAIKSEQFLLRQDHKSVIDLSGVKKGVYVLRVTNGIQNEHFKIIKN